MLNDEPKLVAAARRGDVASFEALIRPYQPKIFRLILALAENRDDAEDALQETLLHAFRALPRFRGDASFGTWLHRVALNTTRNWMRTQVRASSTRMAERLVHVGASASAPIDDELLADERRHLVRRALLRLPEHYQNALLLRHYRDMSYEEIARVLDVPVGTVRSRLAQGRRLLLRELQALGFTDCLQEG